MRLLVCIPTVTGREAYLRNAVKSYRERTPAEVVFSVVTDAPSCGVGWNRCIEQMKSQGRWFRGMPFDFIHFSNDDIVVADGWFGPLAEAAGRDNCVPCPRIEPAGYHLKDDTSPTPPTMMPPGRLMSHHGYFYADLPENQPTQDWQRVDHGALPFCTPQQFAKIGPFIPIHFGTDKWFYHRAKAEGYQVVARQFSVIYNYAAQEGRSKGDWTEQDYLDFDLVFAYPEYVAGVLAPTDEHPHRNTDYGLRLVREWSERR
jgi:hypothetical protein